MRRWRVRKEPSSKTNRGEVGEGFPSARYFCSPAIGQVEVCVAPMVTVQLWRKGSVFDAFMRRCAEMGVRVMSARHKVVWGSNDVVEGEQSSLALRKP